MENKTTNVPAVRVYEAQLQTLGVEYEVLSEHRPNCGPANLLVIVKLQTSQPKPHLTAIPHSGYAIPEFDI